MMSRNQTAKALSQTQLPRRLSVDQTKNSEVNSGLLDEIRKCIHQEMQSFRDEIRLEIRSELHEINQTIDKISNEISSVKHRIDNLESREDRLSEELEEIRRYREIDLDEKALWEQKLRERCIKIRGLTENKNENLVEYLVPKLAEFVNRDKVSFQNEIDRAFRLNSFTARKKNLPRDVVIYLVRRQTRDLILNRHNESPLTLEGKQVQLLKDVPARILKKRKEYTFLTSYLRQNGIPYRWGSPEGLIFWWGKKRIILKNLREAQRFWDLIEKRKETYNKTTKDKRQTSQDSKTNDALTQDETTNQTKNVLFGDHTQEDLMGNRIGVINVDDKLEETDDENDAEESQLNLEEKETIEES